MKFLIASRPSALNVKLAVVLAGALLAGCGGGVYVGAGVGIGDFRDDPPSVSLTSAQTSVPRGATVRLAAAASDDHGIDYVAFYRLDGRGTTSLGSDGRAPYTWDAQMPNDAVGSVQFVARAVDIDGNTADSTAVIVDVDD